MKTLTIAHDDIDRMPPATKKAFLLYLSCLTLDLAIETETAIDVYRRLCVTMAEAALDELKRNS